MTDSRSPFSIRRWVITACLGAVLAACGASVSEGTGDIAQPRDASLVSAGAELYQAHCATCHGTDLRGTDEGPSFLSIVYEPNHHADAAFLIAAQRGVREHHWNFGDMPPVEGVTAEDVTAIAAFVRETQQTEGFEP